MPTLITSGALNAKALGYSGGGGGDPDVGDTVNYSVRGRSTAPVTRLSKTFVGNPATRTKATIRALVRLTKETGYVWILSAGSAAADYTSIYIDTTTRQLTWTELIASALTGQLITNMKFRDYGKFYDIVIALDTANATANDRNKIYVNGVDLATTSGYSSRTNHAGGNLNVGSATLHHWGDYSISPGTYPADAYFAMCALVTESQLDAGSFGRFSADTGAWVPKTPSVTWGTNGHHLEFETGAAQADLGIDTSGNGNTFAVTGFSVTPGTGNDWLTDTPTNTYATMSQVHKGSGAILSNGALDYTNGGANQMAYGTMAVSSGKWYFEALVPSNAYVIGLFEAQAATGIGSPVPGNLFGYQSYDGHKLTGSAYTDAAYDVDGAFSGQIMGFEVDFDTGTATCYRDATPKGVIHTWTPDGKAYLPYATYATTPSGLVSFNFGQRAFGRTPTTGYLPWCTDNLPMPDIGATAATLANKHFDIALRSGTSSATSLTGLAFQPDLIWSKDRNAGANHQLHDVLRSFGLGKNKEIGSSTTNIEGAANSCAIAATSDGVSFSDGSSTWRPNLSGENYVHWLWKANGAGVSNTNGSITSTVSANALAGFSVVTYTGDGAASGTIGHGLGVAPKMIMVKNRDVADSGAVYHHLAGTTASDGKDYFLRLFAGAAGTDARSNTGAMWNDTAPTGTVFSVGTEDDVNASAERYVAYCFAEVEGFSKIGSYVGNGAADGQFVWCGFRPRWVLVKCSGSTGDWRIYDALRPGYNVIGGSLNANTSGTEGTAAEIDFTSNGFKLRVATDPNTSNAFVFYAIAEVPFNYSNAR